MLKNWYLDLSLFEGDGAGAAPAATGDTAGGEAADITPGVLEDGTEVDDRLAARLNEQARRRRDRGLPARTQPAQKAQAEIPAGQEPAAEEPGPDERWAQLKKGEFREQYARDVQAAIQDRFKNQADATKQLDTMKPMLDALIRKNGLKDGDYEGLSKLILDDDSLYEDEAAEAGMSVEAYKTFRQLQAEHDQMKAREAEERENQLFRSHIEGLARQAEELKKTFPNFDLKTEMQNPQFRRMTAPNSGLTLEAAYYAIHHRELAPQAMAYGIQRARQQISQTLQANAQRPVEGATRGSAQQARVAISPKNMSREERQRYRQMAARGIDVTFE